RDQLTGHAGPPEWQTVRGKMRSAQPRNECTPVQALVVVVVRLFPKWCCRIAHTKRTNISCPQQNSARSRRYASHTRLALCARGEETPLKRGQPMPQCGPTSST